MLGTYLIIFIALLGYHVQGASIKHNNPKTITDRLINVIQAKCSVNADDDQYQEAANALNHLSGTCWNSIIPNLLQPSKKNKEVCIEHVPGVLECLTKFAEKLEPCLAQEELFLKQFILDGYQKYSKYCCDNIKTLSFPEALSTKGPQCIRKFMTDLEVNPHNVCYAKSNVFGDNSSLKVITKAELCQDLNNIKSCYATMFDEQCPDAPEFKEFQLGIMNGGLEQCSEE